MPVFWIVFGFLALLVLGPGVWFATGGSLPHASGAVPPDDSAFH